MAARKSSAEIAGPIETTGTTGTTETTEKKKQYTVHSPNSNFCGIGAAGIQFANGVGVINDNGADGDKTAWVIEWYKSHGYTVE